jgi:protein TonB
VRLEATIDERGNVKDVKPVGGDRILAAAAMQAVRTWKYKAATLDGRPIASILTIQVEFKGDNAGK